MLRWEFDAEKEKLLFIAWNGSWSDRFSVEATIRDEKFVISFKTSTGPHTDLYKHTRLFVVPKDVEVETTGGN